MSEGNCSLSCSSGWARAAGSAHGGCQLNGHSSCLSGGTKARQGASECLCSCSPQDLQFGFVAGWQSWAALPLHLPRFAAVLRDGLMSLLLPQRDAGSGDAAVRMAGCSAAGAANWNNAVTPSTLEKLLVIFECRIEAPAWHSTMGKEQIFCLLPSRTGSGVSFPVQNSCMLPEVTLQTVKA